MSASPRGGGLHAFRLSDVPEPIREAAVDLLLKTPGSSDGILVSTLDARDRLAIALAARTPSERVYWVSEAAWEKAARRPMWKRATS